MRVSAGSLTQDDIPSAPRSASVFLYSLDDLAEFDRDIRAASRTVPYIGVSVKLPNESSKPLKIAFATLDEIYLLSLTGRRGSASHSRILQNLFTNAVILAGFEMAYTALLLCRALECDVAGFDLSTISVKVRDNSLTRPGALLYAKDVNVTSKRVDAHWEKLDDGGEPNIGLRAWYSAIAADLVGGSIGSASSLLRTSRLSESAKNLFTDLVSRCQLLDAMKPLVKVNDFTQANWDSKAGRMVIDNERFKTRVRRSETTSIEFQTSTGSVYHGTATGAEGRRTWVQGPTVVGDVKTIRVIGREEATNAEQARYHFLQHALEGSLNDLFDSFFIKAIWDPDVDHTILRERLPDSCRPSESPWPSLTSLNMSQFEVAAAMLSEVESSKLVVAHGPPGTGKTRTIGSATRVWSYLRQPVWIIAQSNVGVKNIAETLFKGDVGFRLVVSKEFYVEWHEDIYEEIKDNIIRSDEIPDDDSLQSIFDTTVVLCTMSTLSNPKLKECGLFDLIRVERLVIDEASQIDIFEFMHLFHKFEKYLLKVCFFGDPKQLPPYGAEEAGLETIFDVKHLKKSAYFLNTQYRMPVLLGSFISTEVYNGKLRSEHNVKDAACILFVDVGKGEEQKTGNSYKNMEEVHTVVRLAHQYRDSGKKFSVITPYDPQRSAIMTELGREGLPSNSVFNVDSFQGNEDDHIIFSSVRTAAPGFLKNQSRMNVALTRCKQGMVVVTNQQFLRSTGRKTLLARLAACWEGRRGAQAWVDWRRVVEKRADLPGIPAPRAHDDPSVRQMSTAMESMRLDDLPRTVDAFAGLNRRGGPNTRLQDQDNTPWTSLRSPPREQFPSIDGSSWRRGSRLQGQWKAGSGPAKAIPRAWS